MLTYILFVFGFVVLIKGADLLVTGASSLAKRYNVPDLVIGLTIVAFGTSTPEMFVNVSASLQDNAAIAIGNVLGSNIANILLILGITSLIYPLSIQRSTTWKELPFSLLAALAVGVMANDLIIDAKSSSEINRSDGLVLLGFFAIFMYYVVEISRSAKNEPELDFKPMPLPKAIGFIVIGLVGLVIGGEWIVNGAVLIAANFDISQTLVGLTIVAVGTSLPELAASAVAAYRRNTDIAIGNVVGSNIFNIFWVLGLSAVIKPLPFEPRNNADILVTVLASLLLFAFVFIGTRHVLQRWQGGLFVLLYATYLVFLVIRG